MEFNANQAIYLQIADMLCEKILLKILRAEERIPSVRELAVQLEVNPNTVMRTYDFLQGLDIILNKRGVGYFVAADGIAKATEYRKAEFVQKELPQFFKTAALLNINFDELKQQYQNQQEALKNNL
jgi:DNA-binding transcriptional regulator YhcF (GntR family)